MNKTFENKFLNIVGDMRLRHQMYAYMRLFARINQCVDVLTIELMNKITNNYIFKRVSIKTIAWLSL